MFKNLMFFVIGDLRVVVVGVGGVFRYGFRFRVGFWKISVLDGFLGLGYVGRGGCRLY